MKMENVVTIRDDFDLQKILESGQCFRVRRDAAGTYRFIAGERVLQIAGIGRGDYEISCSLPEWETIWHPYFDLDRDYRALREQCRGRNAFIDRCMDCGKGLRVLRQDPWEMLITFIISQRKSIPAIARCVEALCRRFGERVGPEEDLYAFPLPEALAGAAEEELSACGLGYRTGYVADTAGRVARGETDLAELGRLPDDELLEALCAFRGVGVKVASCAALFGYGRTAVSPVDVWIDRAVQEECGGVCPFGDYGENGGIMQQYVYYFQKHRHLLTEGTAAE